MCNKSPLRFEFGTIDWPNFGEGDEMPSKTPKQRRTMAAAAHNPAFAKKVGIPQKVAKEFNRADARKGRKAKGRK